MGKGNRQVAHEFYYRGVDHGERRSYSGCSISYAADRAYSYSTVVAAVVPRKGFTAEDVTTARPETGLTLVSFDSMSSTTSRHIGYLRHASPFEAVGVPMNYGGCHMTPEILRNNFLEELGRSAKGLTRREGRTRFTWLVGALKTVREKAAEPWAKELRDRRFSKYLKIDVSKEAEALRAAGRKKAAKAAAETRAILAKYVKERKGGDYCEFMRALFDGWYRGRKYAFDNAIRAKLRSRLCKSDAAYVWPDEERGLVCTSRSCSVPLQEARVMLKAWAAGKDLRTQRIGAYTVLSATGSVIRIGCHRIPRENIVALYEALVGEPLPATAPGEGE